MITLFQSTGVQATECHSLTALNWLMGEWQTQQQKNHTIERWIKSSDKTFEGEGKTANSMEYLRLLEMSGEIFYIAKVAHNPLPVAFKLTHCAKSGKERHFIFENKQHDFPNIIEYLKVNENSMTIKISGKSENSFTIQLYRVKNKTASLKK